MQVLEITHNLWVIGFQNNLMGRKHTFQKYNPLHNKGLHLKAGEAIRTPDIHVGNVITHPHNESESPIIGRY